MPARIVVVDDDEALRHAIRRALRLEGFDVELAADGADAIAQLAVARADLVVLDVLMPVLDGVTVCRRLRAGGDHTPVLMLTAREAVSDRVTGLDAGADDYLTKPFVLEELLARVRALLRRVHPDHDGSLHVDDLSLDPRTREVTRGGRVLSLTPTEFTLLELLLRNPGTVLTRDTISERVWGFDGDFGSNTLDVYVGYLRRSKFATAASVSEIGARGSIPPTFPGSSIASTARPMPARCPAPGSAWQSSSRSPTATAVP